LADIRITKAEGARRQLDAAIRVLFTGEDPLAIHTITAAAHRVLADLDKRREQSSMREAYEKARAELRERFPGAPPLSLGPEQFRIWMQQRRSAAANFLKHADRDAEQSLDVSRMETDHLLLEACSLYDDLNFKPTPEMQAFGRWHLAVYPHEEGDKLDTALGPVHELNRAAQLEVGAFLLEHYQLSHEPRDKER
jgi:hypothetical protein